MIKIGVIGLGKMGGYHASICSQLQSLQAVKLIGVSDNNESNFRKVIDPAVTKSKDYKSWLDKVDAVIVAVPTDFHYPIVKDCLKSGKHVLVEKPITKNLSEAEELIELAQATGLTLHIGHIERFNGAVQEFKKIINQPLMIETHRMGPFDPRVSKDSVVLDLMIHDLDLVLQFANSPIKSLSAQGQRIYSDSCDVVSVQIGFENGSFAHLCASRASQLKKRTMEVHQKNEHILLDFTTQDISIHRQMNASTQILGSEQAIKYKQESLVERVFVHKDNPLKLEIENFINAIKTGTNQIHPEHNVTAIKLTFEIEKILGIVNDCNNCWNRVSSHRSMQKSS
jgi:predicted dehydrogenase